VFFRKWTAHRKATSRLRPVHHQPALGEQPGVVILLGARPQVSPVARVPSTALTSGRIMHGKAAAVIALATAEPTFMGLAFGSVAVHAPVATAG
jgi:hypothetical protein